MYPKRIGNVPFPAPPGSIPHSVARHAWRSDPDATAKGANAAALPHRNLACMRGEIGPRRTPDLPERPRGQVGRTHAPPLGPPQPR